MCMESVLADCCEVEPVRVEPVRREVKILLVQLSGKAYSWIAQVGRYITHHVFCTLYTLQLHPLSRLIYLEATLSLRHSVGGDRTSFMGKSPYVQEVRECAIPHVDDIPSLEPRMLDDAWRCFSIDKRCQSQLARGRARRSTGPYLGRLRTGPMTLVCFGGDGQVVVLPIYSSASSHEGWADWLHSLPTLSSPRCFLEKKMAESATFGNVGSG
ncbi:uncharacterized protein EI97DRAFT_220766 [Westerdykella ornata]|uniref:Uncharacterized protein n=1 Tax=Westerdykella ornata TaxID=318751 RepID=A0A6A6JSI1_WESOR|nr:uncharacterized protein EI97DRAFT_220766 [Westerdykella ornata]KAF2278828.1 hypothetical protein EI97DRAFT_220766 [Westerdykella ornata]